MELTYNVKNKFLLIGGIVISGVIALLLAQLVFADSTGSLLPSSEGTYLQWTPSTGTTHYTLVDESTCNGTTDYNSTNTVGDRDSYGVSLASVPNGSTITAIEIIPCASRNKTGGGSATMNVFYRYNGVDSADAGNYALTGTTPVQLAATTFSGLSFVKGSGSTLQIGAVLSAGTKGARLSRIAVVVTYTPLIAPSSLSGVASTTTAAIRLTWSDNSSNEDGFVVERSTNGVNFNGVATTSANVVSFDDAGLALGTTYYHRVRAFNTGAYSAYTNVATTTTNNVPAAPSNLAATASTTAVAIKLNWTDNSSDENGFKIERGTDGINFVNVATTSANVIAYTDNGLGVGITYYYRVRSFNDLGNSNYSSIVSALTLSSPSVTTNSATSIATSSAMLNGSANPNGGVTTGWFRYSTTSLVSCDDVFGTRVPVSGGTNLGSSTSSVSYSNSASGLSAGTTYYYCAIANNSGGTGFGSVVSFTTTPNPPAAPSNLGATNFSASQNDLAWMDNSSNEDGFKVEQSLNDQFGPFSQIATTSANAISYSDTGLTADQTYYYRVRAFNAGGNSGYTNTAYAITATVVPIDPSNLTATASSSNAILNWAQSSTNEEGFKVERGTDGINFSEIVTKGINAINHVDSGLASGTYYYRVRAFNIIGNSGYSNTASTTIP